MMSSRPSDPVTIEILNNALGSVVDETFVALMKSAYSQNIKERRDHSCALVSADGRLIAQARLALPIHLGSIKALMRVILKKVPLAEMRPGDIYAANDPYEADGTHLPDLTLAMPVFYRGQVVAFITNIAHHADFGGMTPGSMGGGMTEIYQEGLRIPPLKLFDAGELNQTLHELVLLNTRVPEERLGDLNAQIAACHLGARRILEIFEEYGNERVGAAFNQIVARTEARMRHEILRLPDGLYRFEDFMDDDGCGNTDIPIRVAIGIDGDRLHIDFTGSSPQVPGNINCTSTATISAVGYTLKALLDPNAPNNDGVLNVIDWTAEPGSIVNARFPAAVANRAHTAQRIIDVVIGALGPAMRDRTVAAANGANTTAVFTGIHPGTGRRYIYFETLGGGFGGRFAKDGKDGVQVHITNTSNLPIEAIEMDYPLMVENYGLIENSGGSGTHRGGLGLRRTIKAIGHECTFSGSGERFRREPWGVFGGMSGRVGRFVRIEEDGRHTELPSKPSGIIFADDQRIMIETPAAGGYGPPAERSQENLAADLASGKYTEEFIAEQYPHSLKVPER